jgi:membrane protein YdbS with pleckstrin-like domain
MTFTNIEVALADLPTFEDVAYQNLDPSYARMVCAVTVVSESFLLLTALIILALVDIPGDGRLPISVAGAATMVIFILVPLYRFKAARAVGFAIRDHDLILRWGLFWQREVIQPIRRIQHVELTRGPLEKRLGLANIKLFSAGTGKATFTIPGLRLITAARIRRYVLQAERA